MQNDQEKLFLLSGDRCPSCGEEITPADLEIYPRCPYCNHLFPNDERLEDFLLRPVIQRWMSHVVQQFPR